VSPSDLCRAFCAGLARWKGSFSAAIVLPPGNNTVVVIEPPFSPFLSTTHLDRRYLSSGSPLFHRRFPHQLTTTYLGRLESRRVGVWDEAQWLSNRWPQLCSGVKTYPLLFPPAPLPNFSFDTDADLMQKYRSISMSTFTDNTPTAKRVFLRLPSSEAPNTTGILQTFLSAPSFDGIEHYIHYYQPAQYSHFHIITDMACPQVINPNLEQLPHEVYNVSFQEESREP
jgi:hypothetical protein